MKERERAEDGPGWTAKQEDFVGHALIEGGRVMHRYETRDEDGTPRIFFLPCACGSEAQKAAFEKGGKS